MADEIKVTAEGIRAIVKRGANDDGRQGINERLTGFKFAQHKERPQLLRVSLTSLQHNQKPVDKEKHCRFGSLACK